MAVCTYPSLLFLLLFFLPNVHRFSYIKKSKLAGSPHTRPEPTCATTRGLKQGWKRSGQEREGEEEVERYSSTGGMEEGRWGKVIRESASFIVLFISPRVQLRGWRESGSDLLSDHPCTPRAIVYIRALDDEQEIVLQNCGGIDTFEVL